MTESDVKQAAVNKVVVHLQRLGYALTPTDLALVKQAITTLRSTKAAARYMCAVLGGREKCLAPLPTVEVRMDRESKGPATRIPSPQEIKLRGLRLPALVRVAKSVAVRLPKVSVPKTAPSPRVASAAPGRPAAKKARKPAKREAPAQPPAKDKPSELKTRRKPEAAKQRKPKCPPCAETAKPPSASEPAQIREAEKQALPVLRKIDQLTDQALKAEAVATAARETAANKKIRRGKRKKAAQTAQKAQARYDDKLDQVMELERKVDELAAAADTSRVVLKEAHRDKKWDQQTRKTMKEAKKQDEQYQETMSRAKRLVAESEQRDAANNAPRPQSLAPAADEGTALVNDLAAQLLKKRT